MESIDRFLCKIFRAAACHAAACHSQHFVAKLALPRLTLKPGKTRYTEHPARPKLLNHKPCT